MVASSLAWLKVSLQMRKVLSKPGLKLFLVHDVIVEWLASSEYFQHPNCLAFIPETRVNFYDERKCEPQ